MCVKYDPRGNSALVVGEAIFVLIFVGFAQVLITLMKLKDGKQRRLQSAYTVLCL